VRETFIARGGFAFRDSTAGTEAERTNPWRLLERSEPDGAIPAIADANSLAYVLHLAVGDEFVVDTGGTPIRLRIVAALDDSVFQSELIISEAAFVRAFGQQAGYRVLLIDTPAERAAAATGQVEHALSDFGVDVSSTAARLAEYHQVENTYLSTFQTLGGLGLLLGTIGLAAIVLRNVLERRRELALLRAVGYERRDFLWMLLSETGSLLLAGLMVGAACATLAIAPALLDRGGRLPISASAMLMLIAVAAAGVVATVIAARAATAGALLQSLKSE
jgi:ABC-type antimicrobial peptide transport system permease subunit